jgi:hypothetical protein
MEKAHVTGRKTPVVVEIYSGDQVLDRVKTNFLGPGY